MKRPPIPLTDPRFVWIKAADHDADSRPFRERQLARIARMQQPAAANVKPIRKVTK